MGDECWFPGLPPLPSPPHGSTGEEAPRSENRAAEKGRTAERWGDGLPGGERAGVRATATDHQTDWSSRLRTVLLCSARQVGSEGLAEGELRSWSRGLDGLKGIWETRGLGAFPEPCLPHSAPTATSVWQLRQIVSSLTAPKNRGWHIVGPQASPYLKGQMRGGKWWLSNVSSPSRVHHPQMLLGATFQEGVEGARK